MDNRLVVKVPDILKEIVYQECWSSNMSYQEWLRQIITEHFFRKYGANPMTDPNKVMDGIRTAKNDR